MEMKKKMTSLFSLISFLNFILTSSYLIHSLSLLLFFSHLPLLFPFFPLSYPEVTIVSWFATKKVKKNKKLTQQRYFLHHHSPYYINYLNSYQLLPLPLPSPPLLPPLPLPSPPLLPPLPPSSPLSPPLGYLDRHL